jgi:hypothetical protein
LDSGEFDWGHGFVPRVGPRNSLQVDRTLSPTNLFGEAIQLPWAIIDLHWAITDPYLIQHLRQAGTKLLFDSQAWRYREAATFGMPKFVALPHAPREPIQGPGTALRDYVRADLLAQAKLHADAYLIPGFLPHNRDDDFRPITLAAIDHAISALSDLAPKPLVAFLGGHTKNLGAAEKLVAEVHGAVGGLYVQLTPVHPMKDSPAKLVDVARFLLGCRDQGIKVLGGRLAAAGTLLRAVGVDATDAGLAEGETFALNEALTVRKPSTAEAKATGRGPRIYVNQIGLSMNAADYLRLISNQKVAPHLTHRGPCCLFRPMSEVGRFAGEHSLRCRVDEAVDLSGLPTSMRPERALDNYRAKSSLLTTINGILLAENQTPLSTRHIDNLRTALERLLDRPAAA